MRTKKKSWSQLSVIATISLVRLFDGHQIKNHHAVLLFVNFENNSISPPDIHTVYLHLGMQTFYIGCAVWIFKFAEVVEDVFPDLLRIFLKGLDHALLNVDFHSFTSMSSPLTPFGRRICRRLILSVRNS